MSEEMHKNISGKIEIEELGISFEELDIVDIYNYNQGDIIILRCYYDSLDFYKLKDNIFNLKYIIKNIDTNNDLQKDIIENYDNMILYCKRRIITTCYDDNRKKNNIIVLTNIKNDKLIDDVIDRHIKLYSDSELENKIYSLRNIKEINNVNFTVEKLKDNSRLIGDALKEINNRMNNI